MLLNIYWISRFQSQMGCMSTTSIWETIISNSFYMKSVEILRFQSLVSFSFQIWQQFLPVFLPAFLARQDFWSLGSHPVKFGNAAASDDWEWGPEIFYDLYLTFITNFQWIMMNLYNSISHIKKNPCQLLWCNPQKWTMSPCFMVIRSTTQTWSSFKTM